MTRTAVAASASTMNTPYAAKNPSVSAVRPSLRAMITPTTAARPVCTAIPSAVTAPVAQRPESGRSCTLPHGREAYGQRQPTQ